MAFNPPSAEELAGVQRLRERINATIPPINHKFSDIVLLRFYRGMKGIEDDAYKSIMDHAKWRDQYDVNNVTSKVHLFQKELDSGKLVVEGFDKTGKPAIFFYARKNNKNDRDLEQVRQLIIYTMETVLLRTNPAEQRMILCFDLTGFKLSHIDYEMIKLLITTNRFNYPETLSSGYIINAPFLFAACWAIIKPWLDPVTAAKISFVTSEQLAELVSLEPRTGGNVSGKGGSPATMSTISTSGKDTNSVKSTAEINAEFEELFDQQRNPDSPHTGLTISPRTPSKPKKKGWFW